MCHHRRGDSELLPPATDLGEAVQASCSGKLTKQAYSSHGDSNSTSSTTFVALAGGTVPFTVSSKGGQKCVSVLFSSMTAELSEELVVVRAVIDGTVVPSPAFAYLDGDTDEDGDGRWVRSHAMNFVSPPVAPGAHTLQIEFRSFSGGTVILHGGSTIVLYA